MESPGHPPKLSPGERGLERVGEGEGGWAMKGPGTGLDTALALEGSAGTPPPVTIISFTTRSSSISRLDSDSLRGEFISLMLTGIPPEVTAERLPPLHLQLELPLEPQVLLPDVLLLLLKL